MNSLTPSFEFTSTLGQPIVRWTSPPEKAPNILLVGCVHGDEIESKWLLDDLVSSLLRGAVQLPARLIVVPCLNPDGYLLGQRSNANGVDLNRNLPTSNWSPVATNARYQPGQSAASEAETKAFLSMINEFEPELIVSVHSFSKSLVLAPTYQANRIIREPTSRLAGVLGIPVVSEMDYQVLGSLTGFGKERGLATITIELPRGASRQAIIERWSAPLVTFLKELVCAR